MFDVIFKLFCERLDVTTHWDRQRVTMSTDRVALNAITDIQQQLKFLWTTSASLNGVDHLVRPTRTLTTWGTLATGLVVVEVRKTCRKANHTGGVVDKGHTTCTH